MGDSVNVLVFGACLVRGPLNPMARVGSRFTFANYGSLPGTYTLGEIFQAIGVLRGERDVPQDIRPLCNMKSNFRPVKRAAEFSDVDVALLELSSPIELVFRGCYLNRNRLQQLIMNPIADLSRAARKCGNFWLRNGLVGLNETARQETAEELASYIPPDMENAELARAVILETRSFKSDLGEGLRRARELINRPIGVSVYVFQYVADGRAISWPAGFHDEVKAAADQVGLAVFEPSHVVKAYGVKAALCEDLRHYSDEFLPVIGDALVDFVLSVRDNYVPLPPDRREIATDFTGLTEVLAPSNTAALCEAEKGPGSWLTNQINSQQQRSPLRFWRNQRSPKAAMD